MSFSETLKDLLEKIKGAELVMICGADGIPVEHVGVSGTLGPDDLSAESSQIIQDISRAVENLELGALGEVMICTDTCMIVIRSITHEYYFAVVMSPGGNMGKARFLLRNISARIAHEF